MTDRKDQQKLFYLTCFLGHIFFGVEQKSNTGAHLSRWVEQNSRVSNNTVLSESPFKIFFRPIFWQTLK